MAPPPIPRTVISHPPANRDVFGLDGKLDVKRDRAGRSLPDYITAYSSFFPHKPSPELAREPQYIVKLKDAVHSTWPTLKEMDKVIAPWGETSFWGGT